MLSALELLRQRREPYAALLAQIVADICDRFPPLPEGPIVEIGAGTGQLRAWMPPPLRERMVHTDPSEPALRALRDRVPQARVRVAPADRLPFDDGTVAAVVGLCVFDALPDEAAAVAELRRVLRPGGRFLHFMDMATLLEAPFSKLAASSLVPIPNVFGDPGDHEWPLDIVLVKRDWLEGLLRFATELGHAAPTELGGYFQAFCAAPFATEIATSAFKAVASSGPARRLLLSFLETASRVTFSRGFPPIEPLPFHSARYLQSVMEAAFRSTDDFRIELDEIVTRSGWRVTSPGGGAPPRASPRYQSLCLGHQRLLETLPSRLLGEAARQLWRDRTEPTADTLAEVGAFVFVTRRT